MSRSRRRAEMARRQHRRRRGGQGAQAVMEMAMIIPIMIALVANFLALMLEVEGQNRLQAAVNLASQASITAPLADTPHSCQYASQAFWSTVYADTSFASGSPGCPGGNTSSFSSMRGAPSSSVAMKVLGPGLQCTSKAASPDYYTGAGYPITAANTFASVDCTASATFNFSNTPLAFGVFWKPTYTAKSEATPTTVRQCNVSVTTC